MTAKRYAAVTLCIPSGYYVSHLPAIEQAFETFPGLKISQGLVATVFVSGEPMSPEWRAVSEWVAIHLPAK